MPSCPRQDEHGGPLPRRAATPRGGKGWGWAGSWLNLATNAGSPLGPAGAARTMRDGARSQDSGDRDAEPSGNVIQRRVEARPQSTERAHDTPPFRSSHRMPSAARVARFLSATPSRRSA